jgi:hypothetical protein
LELLLLLLLLAPMPMTKDDIWWMHAAHHARILPTCLVSAQPLGEVWLSAVDPVLDPRWLRETQVQWKIKTLEGGASSNNLLIMFSFRRASSYLQQLFFDFGNYPSPREQFGFVVCSCGQFGNFDIPNKSSREDFEISFVSETAFKDTELSQQLYSSDGLRIPKT